MKNDRFICTAFILGADLPINMCTKTRKNGRGAWGTLTRPGALRLSYRLDSGVGTMLSYETWPVAVRQLYKGKTVVLLNGDEGPTKSTREHTWALRMELRSGGIRHFTVPFAALNLAGIPDRDLQNIEVVNTTPDREITKYRKSKYTKVPYPYQVHFLGETLFRYQDRMYVCGLDRNDDPARRNFYLARLPKHRKPRTVDAALAALRPKDVPADTPRQGEWFFVPVAENFTSKAAMMSSLPILSDTAEYQATAPLAGRERRHVAHRMVLWQGRVYVRGPIRDSDHGTLQLGKVWHRVVRNLADGSWGMPTADGKRAKVD